MLQVYRLRGEQVNKFAVAELGAEEAELVEVGIDLRDDIWCSCGAGILCPGELRNGGPCTHIKAVWNHMVVCPECGEVRREDEGVKASMKCDRCNYAVVR